MGEILDDLTQAVEDAALACDVAGERTQDALAAVAAAEEEHHHAVRVWRHAIAAVRKQTQLREEDNGAENL